MHKTELSQCVNVGLGLRLPEGDDSHALDPSEELFKQTKARPGLGREPRDGVVHEDRRTATEPCR